MLTIIRKNQQFLMTIVVILTIISFVWLYNRTNLDKVGSNDVLSLYGKVIQRAEIDRLARSYQLALALGLTDFIKDLGGLDENENIALNNYILNLLVVRHQAEVLGIRPSDDSVAIAIKSLSPLQTDGAFDPVKYAAFVQEQLAPRGFTERQLEDVVRGLSPSICPPSGHHLTRSRFGWGGAHSSTSLSTNHRAGDPFDREKFLKDTTVSPAEIAAFYEKNKAALKVGERRSISFVHFELPAAQQNFRARRRRLFCRSLLMML